MAKFLLECCVDSAESVFNAVNGKADRLEICGNLIIGGTTPDIQLFNEIKSKTDVCCHVLIRPRFGDFCYTSSEVSVMKRDIEMFHKSGANGVVIGALTETGDLNTAVLREMIKAAEGMSVTLSRAFDVCKNPCEALEKAVDLGINTILTSGQQADCTKGIKLLAELQNQAKGRIEIMAGGGVSAETILNLYNQTGITAFHMSGKKIIESKMQYRNPKVYMGVPGFDEYSILRTSEEKVRQAKQVIYKIQNEGG